MGGAALTTTAITRWLMIPNAPEELDPAEWFASILRRPEWHSRAACRGAGTTAFFPTVGRSARAAVAVCGGCQVADECRAHAQADPEATGVWGGTTEKQRRLEHSEGVLTTTGR
jgi:hypothetical protein